MKCEKDEARKREEDSQLEREVDLMRKGRSVVDNKEGEEVRFMSEEEKLEGLEKGVDGSWVVEKRGNFQEEGERVEKEGKGKLKRGVEKKLKWKIEIVEEEVEELKSGESAQYRGEKEGEVSEVLNRLCTNQISPAKQDMSRGNMLPAAERSEGKIERREVEKKFGWREALAVDPLLANLHLKLDHIFFPKAKVCQVPFDM